MPLGFSDAFLFALFKLTFENTSRVPSVSYLLTYLLTLLTLLTYSVTIHTYNTSGAHSSFFSFFLSFPSKLVLPLPPPPPLYGVYYYYLPLPLIIPATSICFPLSLSLPPIHPSVSFLSFFLISQLFIPSIAKQSIASCQSYISFHTTTSSTAAGSPT